MGGGVYTEVGWERRWASCVTAGAAVMCPAPPSEALATTRLPRRGGSSWTGHTVFAQSHLVLPSDSYFRRVAKMEAVISGKPGAQSRGISVL